MAGRTWPDDWEQRRAGADCPFCADGRPDETPFGIRISTGRVSDAYLQRGAPSRGYAIVVWRGPHVADPSEMPSDAASAYWLEVLHVARGIVRIVDPCHLNYEILVNAVPHVHTHLVPRYLDDRSPGAPLRPWGPIPVVAEELRRDADRLRSVL